MPTTARTQKRTSAIEPLRRARRREHSAEKTWFITPPDPRAGQLARTLKVSNLLAQLLINRGVADAQAGFAFLRPKLADLISPELLPGVRQAAQRIKLALTRKQKITLYGDYDVDGITGVAILWQILTLLGANVDYYIPHRIDEGYGLKADAVESIAKAGTKLLITIDCGITARTAAELAGKLNLDLIICDHHSFADDLPIAHTIVHPALDKSYPNPDSSGSLVAFKLGWAVADLFKTGPRINPQIRDFMLNATSLAAMGTIADVMELRGENRTLTSFGLSLLSDPKLPGLTALIESADLSGKGLDSYHIGFRLAPMLNAAGRIGHARLAVELLTSTSQSHAAQIADYLKSQNAQRQRFERKIFNHACQLIAKLGLDNPERKSIVLADPSWHSGVVGIVAARIVDKFFRPTIIINSGSNPAQGSARSIPGFDILAAISACSKHLVTFGGHKSAAGVTVLPENIRKFVDALEDYARNHLAEEQCTPKLAIDALTPLSAFNFESVSELQLLGPFGQGNPQPLFATKNVRLCSTPRRVGTNADHLQLAVTDHTNSIRCIGFRFGHLEKKLLERDIFNIAYHAGIDSFNGNSSIQLVIEDIQFE
ncbi:MAG: single-stranded-DNA-specific exonuclease RecJ [Sedimentisphaerales bacterium]|nr:single-stranded-DNA-specific exonuclease RecJ [Sedimentisphaerales bacterium]